MDEEDSDRDSDYETSEGNASRSTNRSEQRLLPDRTSQFPADRARGNGWRPKCGLRRLRSRGAYLVLLWNLLVFSYQFESLKSILKVFPETFQSDPWLAVFLAMLFQLSVPHFFYPLAGWLADTKFGRYKVMRTSMWLMWVGSVVLLAVLIVRYKLTYPSQHDAANKASVPILIIVYVVNSIGLAGFHANVVPFGLDQMESSSAEQFSAFIHWYYWSRNFSLGLFVHTALYSLFVCTEDGEGEGDYPKPVDQIDLVLLVVEVSFLTLALVLDFLFADWLVKEPQTQNPLNTIWKVSCFAIKHNQPVGHRSAFSYASLGRKLPSRTDLAKRLYGGPFESEEVEAVKSFWNLIALLFALGGGLVAINAADFTTSLFTSHTQSSRFASINTYIKLCQLQSFVTLAVPPLVVATLVIIYEFVVYPFFSRFTLRMFNRMGLGILVALIGVLVLLIQNCVAHSQYHYATCLFYLVLPDWDQRYHLHVAWLVLPILVVGFGEFLLVITAFELICAQAPYSMRGLLIGMLYFISGIFVALTGLILLVIAKLYEHHKIVADSLSCGSMFYLVVLITGLLGAIGYVVAAFWYRKRQRGGHEFVNERAVLESYFEHAVHMNSRQN